jgi:hypothetical protein
MSPKPPDILRKSHRHSERKERATAKEDLREQAAAASEELAASVRYTGACRCGALGYNYTTKRAPADWSIRACECSFCQRHGTLSTSDPAGAVEIVINDAAALERYRFGLATADFLLCKRCGDYVAAVIKTSQGARATVNIKLLQDYPPDLPPPRSVSHEDETRETRIRRREAQWTPVTAG